MIGMLLNVSHRRLSQKKTLTKKHNGIIKMLVDGFIAIPLFSGACFSRAKL